jgi:hypothetical protein
MQNKAAEKREQEALALKEENAMRERALRAEYANMEVCSKESSFHRTELKKKLEGKGERENKGTCRCAEGHRTKCQRMATGDEE